MRLLIRTVRKFLNLAEETLIETQSGVPDRNAHIFLALRAIKDANKHLAEWQFETEGD